MIGPEALAVPPLRSGGVMLSYACNQSCRHCAYRSRPDAGGWMEERVLEETLDALLGERRLIDIHFGGGEPTLNLDLLAQAIRGALRRGIRVAYVETNGSFATTPEKARETLLPLRDAGLTAVLVSVSPYHNEFIPLRTTLNCLEASADVFGPDGVFPWLSHFIPMLSRLDPEVPHTLDEFLAANAMTPGDPELLRLFPLTPGGRVPEGLAAFFPLRQASEFKGGHCLEMLTGVSHFHVDPAGNLFTGHCPGISVGRVPRLHEEKRPDMHPVFFELALGGPHALMETAKAVCGFVPDDRGYVSPCHLCFDVRQALLRHDGAAWPELAPEGYYEDTGTWRL